MSNKVQFGLKKVHYAVLTESATAAPSWGTPKAVPGAVNLQLDANSAQMDFYADDTIYYSESANNGYSGSIEFARIPDDMLVDIFGATLDGTSKVIFEDSNAKVKPFALLAEIDGDETQTQYVWYRCIASRPNINGATKDENGNTPQTQTIEVKMIPVIDNSSTGALNGRVMAKTTAETTSSVKTGWFSNVFTG